MNGLLAMAIGVVAGTALGLVFFGGLWLTVSRLGRMRHPALWMLGSLLVRMTVALAGLAALARMDGWRAVLAALAAMLLARAVLQRRLGPAAPERA
jgi:F1F0 ATPase subunit 2